MERIAGEITEWLILKGEIHESKEEILKYGFEIILSTLWTMLSTITISFVFFEACDAIVFAFFFMSIRFFSGGYHATTYLGCYVCSLSIFSLVAFLSRILPLNRKRSIK